MTTSTSTTTSPRPARWSSWSTPRRRAAARSPARSACRPTRPSPSRSPPAVSVRRRVVSGLMAGSGELEPLRAQGDWSSEGGVVAGRLALTASSLAAPYARRIGPQASLRAGRAAGRPEPLRCRRRGCRRPRTSPCAHAAWPMSAHGCLGPQGLLELTAEAAVSLSQDRRGARAGPHPDRRAADPGPRGVELRGDRRCGGGELWRLRPCPGERARWRSPRRPDSGM